MFKTQIINMIDEVSMKDKIEKDFQKVIQKGKIYKSKMKANIEELQYFSKHPNNFEDLVKIKEELVSEEIGIDEQVKKIEIEMKATEEQTKKEYDNNIITLQRATESTNFLDKKVARVQKTYNNSNLNFRHEMGQLEQVLEKAKTKL